MPGCSIAGAVGRTSPGCGSPVALRLSIRADGRAASSIFRPRCRARSCRSLSRAVRSVQSIPLRRPRCRSASMRPRLKASAMPLNNKRRHPATSLFRVPRSAQIHVDQIQDERDVRGGGMHFSGQLASQGAQRRSPSKRVGPFTAVSALWTALADSDQPDDQRSLLPLRGRLGRSGVVLACSSHQQSR